MMNYMAAAFLAISMFFFSIETASASEKSVTLTGTIQPNDVQADQFTLTVQMKMKKGWHTYGEVGDGSEERTSLELKLPEGVTAKDDWSRPEGIEGKAENYRIYEGQVSFSRNVVIKPKAHGKKIDVVVSYHACTDEFCNPPQNKTVSITIPAAKPSGSGLFEHPVQINADGKPLNTVAKTRFPSPGIFDVDGDGTAELVIGGLMGSVGVYENQNTSGKGDPVWGPRDEFKDSKGKTIRTSNW